MNNYQFNKNNLDKANSPYLKQHQNNPIHWQEWNREVLDYAKKNNKIIFLSIGYSTCHWCHVMADETFSNKEVSNYLNEHFISIKVDREQRPDIDKKMMDFMVHENGQGGWPLNIFLTPNQNPFYPITYLPSTNFLQLLFHVKSSINANDIKKEITFTPKPISIQEDLIVKILNNNFDVNFGGFGFNQKFPPHCTILFMLHYYEETKNKDIEIKIKKTLENMMKKGLHDHLQGGFFRYCTDNEWNIPHFEKMLYDQAMLIWTFSTAYKIFKDENYKIVTEKIIKCLNETFLKNGLFISAHDADTNHKEGLTYLWDYNEIKDLLTNEEFNIFKENYEISQNGNFETKNHLIKKNINDSKQLLEIEDKLLKIRKTREQPFADEKIITSLNALTGISLIHAYRYLGNKESLELAEQLFHNLLKKHYINNKLIHSSFNEKIQEHEFLEDYASFLLFITYLNEETNSYKEHMTNFIEKINNFKEDNLWIESDNKDFIKTEASFYDHPTPSSVSLSELATLRSEILLGKDYLKNEDFKESLNYDFFNISILIKKGLFHIISNKQLIDWNKLPLNSIQIKGEKFSDCYKGSCSLDNRKIYK